MLFLVILSFKKHIELVYRKSINEYMCTSNLSDLLTAKLQNKQWHAAPFTFYAYCDRKKNGPTVYL